MKRSVVTGETDSTALSQLPALIKFGPRHVKEGQAMEEPRKLYRSRNQRMLAGVCGGLAEYFNVDATMIRVLFLALAVFGGSGLVIYMVMWLIVPDVNKA